MASGEGKQTPLGRTRARLLLQASAQYALPGVMELKDEYHSREIPPIASQASEVDLAPACEVVARHGSFADPAMTWLLDDLPVLVVGEYELEVHSFLR
jgi:hypothetical protein